MAPVCPDVDRIETFSFSRVFDGAIYCIYVCEHPNPTPTSQATICCKVAEVSGLNNINVDLDVARIDGVLQTIDLDCVTDGKLVSLALVNTVLEDETIDKSEMKQIILRNAFSIDREIGRNDIMEKLLTYKLGPDFTVSHTSMTKRKGKSYNPYSKSRQDLYIQYKETVFRHDAVRTGIVTTGSPVVEASISNEGEVITGILEFKRDTFEDNQTLAEMLCCLTDCTIEQLKKGNRVKTAIGYGCSVNYLSKTAEIFKLTLDFVNNCSEIMKLQGELPICEALNFLIASLK